MSYFQTSVPENILGIDISKAYFDVCLLHAGQRRRSRFSNSTAGYSQLFAWLEAAGVQQTILGLEATGPYSDGLARAAHTRGHRVLLLNPRRVLEFARASGRRNKTDQVDAELIARFIAQQEPASRAWWQPLPSAQAHLRELLRRQADIEQTLHGEQRRLEVGTGAVTPSLRRTVAWLEKELARLEKEIQAHLRSEPALAGDVARLRQIKGCGEKTARLLVAEIPRHFRNARAAAAWLGVVPRSHQSGSSVRRASQIGHEAPWLRAKLYFPAITAMRCDPRCQAFANRLRAAGKPPMSIVMAVLHKLIRSAFAILKSGSNYDPNHRVQLPHSITTQPLCSP